MKKLTFLTLLLVFSNFLFAQEKIELGGIAGYSNYLGDLVEPTFTFSHANFAGGLFLRYEVINRVHLRSNLLLGKLEGNDANYAFNKDRAAMFETTFTEFALMAEYDFLKIKKAGGFKESYSPYVFAGAGFSLLSLDVEIGSSSQEVSADLREDISDIQPIVAVGLGLKYAFAKNWKIGVELGIRKTFTDYLDGVSKSGDPNDKDAYVSGGVTVSYLLGNTDEDNDGIVNKKDHCPNEPGPERFNGCPDTDGDGLSDAEDECPNDFGKALLEGCPDADDDGVPDHLDDCPDDKGIRRFGGCPDSDNDNIVDLEDNCPDEAGIPSTNGCPDSDRDGVIDAKDECPLEAGSLFLNGCPDFDNDGIPNKDDDCPREAGKLENKGCPHNDMDNDGIVDRIDSCPELPGLLENNGCPEIKKEDQAVLDFAMSNIEFETGSDGILRSSLKLLDKIADLLSKYKGYHLQINGHTDNVGAPEDNKALSEDRARACYDYLFTKGVNPTVMSYKGYGETMPISDNETEEGRRQNRRVEFVLITIEK